MKVSVQLFANLQEYACGKESPFIMDLAPEATVEQLITHLKIPSRVQRVVLLNGRQAKGHTRISEGDKVVLFPPVTGG